MKPRRKAWLVMIAAYVASVAVALNEFKVPPVMGILIDKLKVDLTTGGWLMSSFAVAGVILGIPAAIMLGKIGPKSSGLIALGCTILGSMIGALANDPVMLLLGRVVEGIGLGVITVVAPAVISMWFPPEARGTPMGIWASWVPSGSFLMFNLAGILAGSFGWQGVWWFGAIFALVAFVIYAAVVAAPEALPLTTGGPPPFSAGGFGKLLLNPASWILALVFGTFNFTFIAYSTWAPLYLNKQLGLGVAASSFNTSLFLLAIIPSTILAGWVLDRTGNRYRVLTASLLIAGILLIWSFQLSSPGIVVFYMLVLGLVGGFIPTSTFTLAPETMPRPELAGLALGIVTVGQNLGMLVGPPVVGAIIAGGNWDTGVFPLVGSIVLGLAASFYLQRRSTKSRPVTAMV